VKLKLHSNKTVNISCDEWNVWFHSDEHDKKEEPWQIAPHLLEDEYTFEDALVVGGLLSALINHSDRVKIACMAQLVNVIAPIMTENGGKAWRQTIFYPFMLASKYGRGTALQPIIDCPHYDTSKHSDVPMLDVSAVLSDNKTQLTLFILNRHMTEDVETEITLRGFEDYTPVSHLLLQNDDMKAVNTKEKENVFPVETDLPKFNNGILKTTFPKHSWNVVRLEKK